MMHGHEKSDLVMMSCEADEQSEESSLRRRLRGRSQQRSRWSEGRGPRGIRTSKARTGTRTRLACHGAGAYTATCASHTRGRSRMRESRTYGSGRGACHEMHVPTATEARVHCGACWRGGFMAARSAGQQAEPIRRIGVLFGPEDDPQVKAQLAAFRNGLEKLGWSEGRNVQIDYRFASATIDTTQVLASELIAWQPDVIFGDSTRYTAALQQQTRTIPIVFNGVADPIGAGFIASLARPGGNLTGLMLYEASVAGKWLAMLKEIAPRLSRVALVQFQKLF